MIGEIEFEGIFHEWEDGEFGTQVYYKGVTYTLFILFLCMVTIVAMNLLTGLAVGDVGYIREQAKLKKLAMQVQRGVTGTDGR